MVLRPLYQVILLTKLTASTLTRVCDEDIYRVLCQCLVVRPVVWWPAILQYCSLEMETMQEEADTETGPDILTSAEYANLESEGITLLTRQLQVKTNISY